MKESKVVKKKKNAKKPDPERTDALKALPPNVRATLTEEEVELFLHGEEWPEELFEKLKDFMVEPD